MLFLASQELVQPGRQPQKPRHGSKGKLQADGGCREGVLQQDAPKSRRHGRGRIVLPPEQGCKTQERKHDAGPDYGGAPAGHQGIKRQCRDGHQGAQPLAAECDCLQKERQKAAVHAGDGKDMVDPRLGEVGLNLRRQSGLVSCQDAAQQRGSITGKQAGDAVHQGVPGPDRPPADGSGSAVGDPERRCPLPCFIGQQKDPLGGERGHVLIVDRCGAFQCDSYLHALAGRKLQQIRLAVEHQLSGKTIQQNGDLGSVIRWLGIIRQSQCDALAAG